MEQVTVVDPNLLDNETREVVAEGGTDSVRRLEESSPDRLFILSD